MKLLMSIGKDQKDIWNLIKQLLPLLSIDKDARVKKETASGRKRVDGAMEKILGEGRQTDKAGERQKERSIHPGWSPDKMKSPSRCCICLHADPQQASVDFSQLRISINTKHYWAHGTLEKHSSHSFSPTLGLEMLKQTENLPMGWDNSIHAPCKSTCFNNFPESGVIFLTDLPDSALILTPVSRKYQRQVEL